MTRLLADHEQIDRFFRTVFPYASVGQAISVRAFFEGADKATSEYNRHQRSGSGKSGGEFNSFVMEKTIQQFRKLLDVVFVTSPDRRIISG
jgi:hypothetical protein